MDRPRLIDQLGWVIRPDGSVGPRDTAFYTYKSDYPTAPLPVTKDIDMNDYYDEYFNEDVAL